MEAMGRPGRDAFTNGRQIGATLEPQWLAAGALCRHPRRPYHHGVEVGVLPIPEAEIVTKWRLQPGKMRWSISSKAAYPRRRAQVGIGAEPSYRDGSSARRSCSRTCRTRRNAAPISNCHCSIGSRCLATPRKTLSF